MNECRKGGAAVLWGVQKIKGRKKDRGARLGLELGLGLKRVGSREYIRVVDPFFLIFTKSFSLFLFLEREALFSLLLLRWEGRW